MSDAPVQYGHPDHVELRDAGRPLLSLGPDGFVAIDEGLLALWRAAAGRSLEDLSQAAPPHADLAEIVPAALACLAEAGLLARTPTCPVAEPRLQPLAAPATVSAVIVVSVPGELVWLEPCVRALAAQRHTLDTVLVVDNAVGVDIAAWLSARGLAASVRSLPTRTNYATALNAGCGNIPPGDYVLILNADIAPHPACVRNLVARALQTPRCAAVAPKLYFWRTPAFMNGIGNRVPGWGFGTDNGIGQLDLGQLDDWTEVPSGCFGAILIARAALQDVGPFDTGYPLYYEDIDWNFRARLQGYRIGAAPDAHALHAYGGSWSDGEPAALSTRKLENALIGQVRFPAKVGSPGRAALLVMHALHDAGVNLTGALRTRDGPTLAAHARAAARVAAMVPGVLLARRRIQARRVTPDADLFRHADDLTPSMTWRNLPELTCAGVRDYYAPLMRAGRTRPLPEITRDTPPRQVTKETP